MLSKSKLFIFLSLSFILGILTASVFRIPTIYSYLFLAASITIMAVFFYAKNRKAGFLFLFITAFLFGILRLNFSFKPNEYENILNTKRQMEGYIVEDPDIRTDKQLLTFLPKGHNQRILITTSLGRDYFYGQWAVVEGKIAEPKSFEDFDYKGYLERFNVTALSQYPKILVLKDNRANKIKYLLLKTKSLFVSHVSKYLNEPQNSLLLGILIGAKKTIPADILENFNLTGTSHIVAVSGYNISVIIVALMSMAIFLGRRLSFWISLVFIFAFTIMSGASASVLRAAAMGILLLLAGNIGRLYVITPSLVFAAVIMLLFNPKILFWDISFQLSFAATLGIVFLMPKMEDLTEKLPKLFGIKSIVFTTIAATISTLPLILFYFGRLSLVSIFANVLILPFIPATMLLGFLIALPFVSPGFAFVANWLLIYILKIAEFLARLPFSSLDLKLNPYWLIAISLIPLGLFFWLRHINNRNQSKSDY